MTLLSRLRVCALALSAFLIVLADLQAQSTPTTATLKEWDVFAATGGDGEASQNVAAILMDVSGIAGPAGNVWFTLQNPLPRLGRLDPSAAANNYIEWRPVSSSESGGPPLGIALNRSNADVWIAMQGDPSFVIKLAGTNTFRRFRASYPLVPHGITVAADDAAFAALPSRNAANIGDAIIKVPRNATNGSVTATFWVVGGEPRHVTLDNNGNVWFTAHSANTLGRLNPVSGVLLEWALPSGSNPSGVRGLNNTICVASEGAVGTLTGVEHCLDIPTNQITSFAGGGFDFPQQTAVNSDSEVFVTEQNGNALSFSSNAARAGATVTTVTPTSRTVVALTTTLFVSEYTTTPVTHTITPVESTLTGVDTNGVVRFTLPAVNLTYPFAQTAFPQPVAITPVFNDNGRGTGAFFFGSYFDGPIGRYAAARVGRFELVSTGPPPETPTIITNPQTLRFDASVNASAPSPQAVAISELNGRVISWTATKTASWLSVTPSSGSTPSSMSVSVNHASLSGGTYSDTITIDDGPGNAEPKTISVTFNVIAPPTIGVSPSSLAFFVTAGGGLSAAQRVQIANTGGGSLDWTATTSQPWLQLSHASGTAPSNLDVVVNASTLTVGTRTATITLSAVGATNSPQTINVTVNVAEAPPAISLAPASLSFSAAAGGANPASQTLSISNSGGGTLVWSASSSQAWLSISPASGKTSSGANATATVSVNIANLSVGVYTGTIQVVDPNAANSPQSVTVALTIRVPAPAISISPSSLTFATLRGRNPATQTITLSNSGDGPLNFTATPSTISGGSWLAVSPSTGTVAAGASATLTVVVTSTTLASGNFSGSISVADANASNSPQSTAVSLAVNPAPTIGLSSATLSFTGARQTVCNGVVSGTNPASQTLSVSNTGDGSLSYAITDNAPWLTVSPTSGTIAAGGAATPLTLSVNLTNLAVGVHTATVTIADANATNSPQTVIVTLTVTAAPVRLCVAPTTLNLGNLSRSGTTGTVSVSNVGDGGAIWTTSFTPPPQHTVTVTPSTGGNGPTTVAITVKASTKARKITHSMTVTFTDAAGSTAAVTLTWRVGSL